jgi:hypothetical protein
LLKTRQKNYSQRFRGVALDHGLSFPQISKIPLLGDFRRTMPGLCLPMENIAFPSDMIGGEGAHE